MGNLLKKQSFLRPGREIPGAAGEKKSRYQNGSGASLLPERDGQCKAQ
jgi:hypothetical protein